MDVVFYGCLLRWKSAAARDVYDSVRHANRGRVAGGMWMDMSALGEADVRPWLS